MPMHLRDDQSAMLDRALVALHETRSVLLVAPTGSGKTVCFSSLTRDLAATRHRIYILCHRVELLDQISATLDAFHVWHGCIAPGRPNHRDRAVQVASVFTLARRLADYAPPDLLVIDEAHHAIPGTTWGKVLSAWPNAARLGVTATPERLSGEGLGDTFRTLIVGPTTRQLIDAGSLSDYRLFAPPAPSLAGVHRRMGDYVKADLAFSMDKPTITGSAIQHYVKLAKGKRALVFCVSLEHAQHVAEEFVQAGITARRIDGQMQRGQRKQLVREFSSGQVTVLTSCDVVSEGFDLPAIEVAILLRPTESLALHLQQMGRALRTYPGKDYALILDHAGNTIKHGLPDDEREWSLDPKATRQGASKERSVSVKTCPECFMACRSELRLCPNCGLVFPVGGREVQEVDGELLEIVKNVTPAILPLRYSMWLIQFLQSNKSLNFSTITHSNELKAMYSQYIKDCQDAARIHKQQRRQCKSYEQLVELGVQRGYKHPQMWAKYVMNARNRPNVRAGTEPVLL